MKVFVSIPEKSDVFNTFIDKDARKYLEKRFEVSYLKGEKQLAEESFREAVCGCDAVITGWGHAFITQDMLKDTFVKYIAHTGGSVASLVSQEVYQKGVRIFSGNEIYAQSVAEGTVMYILMGLRRAPDYIKKVKNGGWAQSGDYTKGLLKRNVGIIGFGAIARHLVQKLTPFDAKIKIYSSHAIDKDFLERYNASQVSLDEALKCDVVSLHSALNEKTKGMIGKEQLRKIKDGALFINTARGRIVDEKALICELEKNRFDAVLDVYENEPLQKDSPLRRMENVYPMPHMAGPTIDLRQYITIKLADNLLEAKDGKITPLEISGEYAKRMTVGG